MPASKFSTTIIVTQTNKLHSGRTAGGEDYTIYQVIATKPTGEVIPQSWNLRSFEDLPKNAPIEVDVELFRSAKYGDSYTVKQKGTGSGLAAQVKDLQERVKRLENFLTGRGEFVGTAPIAPAAPAGGPAPPPPPPPIPPGQAAPAQPGPPAGPIATRPF